MRLAALRAAYDEDDTPLPWEAFEVAMAERFGWTFEELDRLDWGRLLRGMDALNVYQVASKMANQQRLTASEHNLMGDLLTIDLEDKRRRGKA